MQSDYVFTEHSPSTTTYIRSGRGGAGNTFRATSPSSSSCSMPPPSTSSSATSTWTPRRFFSGIGGAGNVHEADQMRRPALLRSLELESPNVHFQQQNPPVGYVGRGGAGNVYRSSSKNKPRCCGTEDADACSLASSASSGSSMSAKAKAWAVRVSSRQ